MIPILSAANTALLILAAGYLYFVIKYQINTWEDEKSASLSKYVWSVSVGAAAVLLSSVLFFLYDFKVIYLSDQRDLSVITRTLFVVYLIIAYSALEWKKGRIIVPVSLIMAVLVFIIRTLA